MIRLYTLVCLSIFLLPLSLPGQSVETSQEQRGYIVTLSGDRLTGKIGDVIGGSYTSFVLFINDFGTPYMLRAELIRGFAFQQGESVVRYETHYSNSRCMFMKVVVKGEGISLYRSLAYDPPSMNNPPHAVSTGQNFTPSRYYIVVRERGAIPVKRWGFRRNMRKLLQERAPELSDKIGDKGYRYKNLETIIKEYNEEFKLTRYTL